MLQFCRQSDSPPFFCLCPPGEDKGEGNRYQHFHAKERLPAGGGEPVRPAALHVLLHPAGLQPPAAVPLIQPHHAAGLVRHTQLHRPHIGKNQLTEFKLETANRNDYDAVNTVLRQKQSGI